LVKEDAENGEKQEAGEKVQVLDKSKSYRES
jgi:hypothetical protein